MAGDEWGDVLVTLQTDVEDIGDAVWNKEICP